MLARHAEMLFWCGRYLERAEDAARSLDVTYHGLLESPPAEARRSWMDLLAVLGVADDFQERHRQVSSASVSEFLVLDAGHPGSIVSTVGQARENARGVRELISSEFWEAINTFHLELQARDLRDDLDQQPYELYGLVKRRIQTVHGAASETMPRDEGWRFLMLGWMLERAEMMCRLLDVRFGELAAAADIASFQILVGVLKSASASEAYRKAYGATMDRAQVIRFLLLSHTFPRGVLYCLRQAEKDLLRIGVSGDLSRPARIVGRLRAELEFADVPELLDGGLRAELDRIQAGVRDTSDALAQVYFRNTAVDLHPIEFAPAG
jgi:uncharacterized alpha-E superfamily protein